MFRLVGVEKAGGDFIGNARTRGPHATMTWRRMLLNRVEGERFCCCWNDLILKSWRYLKYSACRIFYEISKLTKFEIDQKNCNFSSTWFVMSIFYGGWYMIVRYFASAVCRLSVISLFRSGAFSATKLFNHFVIWFDIEFHVTAVTWTLFNHFPWSCTMCSYLCHLHSDNE